jgi:hypothetical protein
VASLLNVLSGKRVEGVHLPITGPLRVHSHNPRYFTNETGRAVLLTGSHTWANLIDIGRSDPPRQFDYARYLDFLSGRNHNFCRLWVWEQSHWLAESLLNSAADLWLAPLPYMRTGPGVALDGKPRFDVTKFNEAYFSRLRARVWQAEQRGIYVAIMLFNGFSIERKNGKSNPWRGHPFNLANNINGVDGDLDKDGEGLDVHTLANPAVTALQETYVRKVVDTIHDLDNVLFEISNESRTQSCDWQYHMIGYLKQYESGKPKQHPVGMTVAWPDGKNSDLWNSPADWISPNGDLEQRPCSDGRKVVIDDTDHLCGLCGNSSWVWKSFLSGCNPVFMDPYDVTNEIGTVPSVDLRMRKWELVRRNMGYVLAYANRLNLAEMVPDAEVASSGYCLASFNVGSSAYLVYFPDGRGTVRLAPGRFLRVEWFRPANGKVYEGGMTGPGERQFSAPFRGEAVLYVHERVN